MPTALADLQALDLELLRLLNQDGGAWVDRAARLLSSHAFGGLVALTLAALLWRGHGREAGRPVLGLALAVGLSDLVGSQLIRPLIDRQRPCYALPPGVVRWLLPAADVHSLPSLHASNLFALAAAATLADRQLAALAYPLAALVALSRVYGGVHWPSDILAGALWGSAAGAAAFLLATRAFRPRPAEPAGRHRPR